MNRKKNSFVSIGIPSLFLIFSVLCLVVLSLLTLGTSRSDFELSRQALSQTSAYYEACGTATDLYIQAGETASQAYSRGQEEYYAAIEAFADSTSDLIWDGDTQELSFEVPFSKSQSLLVKLDVPYPRLENEPYLEITVWKTIPTGSWKADTRQKVYPGVCQEE